MSHLGHGSSGKDGVERGEWLSFMSSCTPGSQSFTECIASLSLQSTPFPLNQCPGRVLSRVMDPVSPNGTHRLVWKRSSRASRTLGESSHCRRYRYGLSGWNGKADTSAHSTAGPRRTRPRSSGRGRTQDGREGTGSRRGPRVVYVCHITWDLRTRRWWNPRREDAAKEAGSLSTSPQCPTSPRRPSRNRPSSSMSIRSIRSKRR